MSESAPPGAPSSRAALLLIRAWVEDASGRSLRARVTEVPNLDAATEVIRLAGTREDLHAMLDDWLDRLFEPGRDAHD